ncbi:MAG: ACP S-malonyltransferase [Anaerolineales bacterium]|nr:ACP S-malonyltransferase [Anaerolineales bacterium]
MTLDFQHTAFLFPGQGSQSVGMGRDLAARYEIAQTTFEEANEILGFDLARLMWEGPEDELNDTLNTQPALYVHSIAAYRVMQECFPHPSAGSPVPAALTQAGRSLQPAYAAGHSLGELSAMTAAGALPFADGVRLVRRRGELMKRAGQVAPGGMAAILGLDIPTLESLCAQASRAEEIVKVANDNCPGQVVLSGAKPALERVLELAQAAGARRAVLLAVSIAAHSPLMASAEADFKAAVDAAPFADARLPVVSNITAQPISKVHALRADLNAQLTCRVRWTESIQFMLAQGVTTFLEIGAGSVLTSLVKRISGETTRLTLGTPEDFEKLREGW